MTLSSVRHPANILKEFLLCPFSFSPIKDIHNDALMLHLIEKADKYSKQVNSRAAMNKYERSL